MKSSSDTTKTQGENDAKYEAHDRSGDEQYQSEKTFDYKSYRALGAFIGILLLFSLFNNGGKYSDVLETTTVKEKLKYANLKRGEDV